MIDQLQWESNKNCNRFLELLSSGAIVLGTSDTVIGLYAALTKKGFNELNRLKGRSEKPYLILLSDIEKALSFCAQDHQLSIRSIMEKVWPGPVTLILRAKEHLPRYLTSSDGKTIALRVPAHAGLQNLLKSVNGIFSTSANKTGQPIAQTIKDVDPEIGQAVAAIIQDGQKVQDVASTILDCTGDTICVVREGVVSLDDLDIKT